MVLKTHLNRQNNVAELIPLIAKYGGTSVRNESSPIAISTDKERKQIYGMTFNIRRLAKTAHQASKATLTWLKARAFRKEKIISTEMATSTETSASTENATSITSFDDYQRISPLCDQAAVALVVPRETSAAVSKMLFDASF